MVKSDASMTCDNAKPQKTESATTPYFYQSYGTNG